jgi:epoxyqueuosine reductase
LQNDKRHELAEWIKSRAIELGFSGCGITEAGYLQGEKDRLENWLEKGYHGEMHYMTVNVEKRLDPAQLVPGAKSVIVLLMNYFPEEILPDEGNYKIAKYAYGKDYHDIIKGKLHRLIKELSEYAGPFQARAFTDSAPVLERAWAEKAGLGWIGKNTCLIHPKIGSFAFIAAIITDLELESDNNHINDLCGGCTRCIDYCPTGAIIAPRILDSRKCISYLTIEYRGELPQAEKEQFDDWIFGCDICQDVCPWNKKSQSHNEDAFKPLPELKEMSRERWHSLTREDFNRLFKSSAVKRTRFEGLKRNIGFLENQDF